MNIQNDNLFVFCKGSLVLDSWFLTKPNYSLRALGSVVYGVVFLPMHLMQLMLLAPLKSILMWNMAPFKESSLRLCRTLAHIPALLIPSKVEKAEISQIEAYQKVIQKGSLAQSALLINQLREQLDNKTSQIEELEKQQAALKEQQGVNKRQIEDFTSRIEELEEQKRFLPQSALLINQLREQLDNKTSQIKELEEQQAALEKQQGVNKRQIEDFTSRIKELEEQQAALEKQQDIDKSQIKNFTSRIKELEEQQAALEKQQDIDKSQIENFTSRIKELEEQKTALENQQSEYNSRIISYKEELNNASFLFKARELLGREVTQETLELLKWLISNPELANSLKWSEKDSDKKNYSVFFNDNGTEKSLSNISTRIFCVKPVDGGASFLAAEIPKGESLYTKRILGKGADNTARLVRAIDPVTWDLKYYVMKKEANQNSPVNESMVNTLQASLKKNPIREKCFVLPVAKGCFLRRKESKNHSNTVQKIHLEEVCSKDLLVMRNKMPDSSTPFSALYSTLSPLFIGLDRLHELGLFHSDIKHQNIFLTEDNKALLGDWDVTSFTDEFSEPFAVLYQNCLSPDKIHNATNQANDVWALGVVIADMLYAILDTYKKQNPTQNVPNIQYSPYDFLVFNVHDNLIPTYINAADLTFDEKKEQIEKVNLPLVFNSLEGCFKECEAAFNATELCKNPVEKKHFDFLLGICRDILLKDHNQRIKAWQIMERVRKFV